MAIKQCFCGEFNFRRQMKILYCYAYTERQAWAVFCKRISAMDNVPLREVMGLFNGEKDNYKIDLELEIKEDKNG